MSSQKKGEQKQNSKVGKEERKIGRDSHSGRFITRKDEGFKTPIKPWPRDKKEK